MENGMYEKFSVVYAFIGVLSGCSAGPELTRYSELSSELQRAEAVQADSSWAGDVALFAGLDELGLAPLLEAVLARNPSIEASRQAWRAALARLPVETSLDDTTLAYTIAPGSVPSEDIRFGQVIQVRQRFPWPGKLDLRGAVVLAEAAARREDYATLRLNLGLIAALLFEDYFLVTRFLVVNAEHIVLLERLAVSAGARYSVGLGSQLDPIQAEVELAHLDHRRMVLLTRLAMTSAQLNGLLHRPPEALLPPPAQPAVVQAPTASADEMLEEALTARPELLASQARISGAESRIDVALSEYDPDVTLAATYNSMWAQPEHQVMIGFSINIPWQLARRDAAVDEAEAQLARLESEHEALADEIRVDVVLGRLRLVEAHYVVGLYEARLLPAAREQLAAAEAGFGTARNDFSALIEAQRNLLSVELGVIEALSEIHSSAAELDRVLGRLPALQGGTP
jgi:outer membrane protein TolC